DKTAEPHKSAPQKTVVRKPRAKSAPRKLSRAANARARQKGRDAHNVHTAVPQTAAAPGDEAQLSAEALVHEQGDVSPTLAAQRPKADPVDGATVASVPELDEQGVAEDETQILAVAAESDVPVAAESDVPVAADDAAPSEPSPVVVMGPEIAALSFNPGTT